METQQLILEELQQLHHIFRKQHHHPKPYGKCHPAAFFTMIKIQEYCEEHPEDAGVGVGELSGVLEVSMPAVSKMLRNLEERQLIERLTDPRNRRNVYVRLTAEGKMILAEAAEHEQTRLQAVAQALGEEDLTHLVRIMKKLMDWEKNSKEVDRC